MSELLKDLAKLPAEKRKLLEMLLKEQGVDLSRSMIVPQSREKNEFPLSFAQQRLWFLDQLEPGSPMYNIPSAVRLSGHLDLRAFERALSEIVRRHEALRTTFISRNGSPVQIITPELALDLPVVDLRHLPETEREDEALRLAQEEAQQPFDLTADPMLRVRLLQLADREWVVLLTMHHIASDGWSMGVLIGELAALYEAFSQERPSPLSDLSIQYADFAVWQRQWLRGKTLDDQVAYWKQQLGDGLAPLELPTDRPRPAFQSVRGASISFALPQGLLEGLKVFGQQERATLFMTLLAAFQALLHRYSGQESVNVGSPIANRTRAEIEGLIGFFVNTLVLRADFSGDPTFRELLQQVREVTLAAYAHQDVPFEMLVEVLQPERDTSHSPLFQAMFVLQNAPTSVQQLSDLTLRPLEVHSGTSTFDVTLSMTEMPAGLQGALEYNTDVFDSATIVRMVGHLQRLLEGIIADPDRRVSQLPLLTRVEREQILVEWNATGVEYPRSLCLHQLFEASAQKTPDAQALVWRDQSLTFAELNRRANRVAHYLLKLGVGPETLVGLCVDRSLEMVIGLLGILKAGGAYLPLDPAYPQDRLTFMVQDSGVRVLLTQESLAAILPTQGLQVVCLDADWPFITLASQENPASCVDGENAAYIIYTSGSTGKPKGVIVPHRAVVNHNRAMADLFQLSPVDRVLQFSTINFDAALEEMFPAWWAGATVVLRADDMLTAGTDLLRLIKEQRLTVLDLPTAYWHEWVVEMSLLNKALPESLRLVIVGGEKVSTEKLVTWQGLQGADRVAWFNTYGPTEGAIVATAFQAPIGKKWRGAREVPIGRPISNVKVHILDKNLQPVPVGIAGELHIGGAAVARGYLNRPALTAERFIADPFSESPAARLYKTGDLCRYRSDGHIEFLGRVDHQVKVRGFRIELGEIEAVLEKHPAVQAAVTVVREDAPGNKRLVAYVVPADGAEPAAGELSDLVRGKLPEYMVPSAFVMLEALPLTPSGKVDRDAMPTPEWSREGLGRAYIAPRTPVEELLAGLFAVVLGVERVGIHDNFFELGGHSLLATRLVSRLRQVFEVELPLRELFGAPTVAGLAGKIEAAQKANLPPITPLPRDEVTGLPVEAPLSFAQQRLWFLDQLEPGSPMYNIPDAVRVNGTLDVLALAHSLNEIVRRHEVLRTTFRTQDGRPAQVVAPEVHLALPLTDLGHLPAEEREAEALRLAQEEAQRPFDLARGPLLRARLLRLEQQDHFVLLTMHHIVSDGWSMGVLIRELSELYPAFLAGQPSSLLPLPLQYVDFAHWQRGWLQGEALEAQLDYWRQQLAGSPPLLELPTDRPRPAMQTYRGDYRTFVLSPELSQAIKELGRQEGATLFMTLLAAFQTLLYRYSGQEDISVGTPIANRNRAEVEGLIGFFVNTLVIRGDLSGGPSFRELLGRLREAALGAYAHQDLPFEMVVDALQPQRELSHNPLFQVMFVLQNAMRQAFELPGLTLSPVEVDTGVATFDLTLAMEETPEGLSGAVEYNTDLFDRATIERLVGHFCTLLEAIVAQPDSRVCEVPLLTGWERQQLLEWNASRVEYPQQWCMHHVFELQAARTPEAVAVVRPAFDGVYREVLSYGELDRRANQLAHYLQKLGVGPGTLVGISLERSLEMLVGLLGVLKAGGAYLPLDPAYPPERLAFMVEDSAAKVVLTQAHLKERIDGLAEGQTKPSVSRLTVCLDSDWPSIAQEPEVKPGDSATPDHLAYVIYTSGSTGRPKGVMVAHRSVVNHNLAVMGLFELFSQDRVLQFSTVNFDAAVEEIFPIWAVGGAVVLRPAGALIGGQELLELVESERITVLDLPTAYWHEWVYEMSLLGEPLPESLRLMVVGGDKVSAERLVAWQSIAGADRVTWLNTYGPTEGTIIATAYRVPLGVRWDGSREVPIGRPIANVQVHVLDGNLQPAPVGVPGELHIGGQAVAVGYLNRPELTAERFIADPFGGEAAGRLYKTGDLCRYRRDGHIEFLGRVDHQVKVRGFRIELGEIEAALSQHPALRDAVVVARDDSASGKQLTAYVVAQDSPTGAKGEPILESSVLVSELRGYLSERLPEYMLPSAYVVMEALPRMPGGKVDRRVLPAPDETRPELEAAYEAPRTAAEETLAGIWAAVLGVEQVGVHDSFFELGGD
ncbi:MAG: amino acid adenylation domain-containing protein, partial [Chloroflexota bacterium]